MVLDLGSLWGWGEGEGVRLMSLDTLELTVLIYLTTSLLVFQFPIIDGFFHHRSWRTKGHMIWIVTNQKAVWRCNALQLP